MKSQNTALACASLCVALLGGCGDNSSVTAISTPGSNDAENNNVAPGNNSQPQDNTSAIVSTESGAPLATLSPIHSLLCVEVPGNAMENNVAVVQADCDSGTNQSFQARGVGNGLIQYAAAHSGKCLQVRDDSTELGALIIQGNCANDRSSLWKVDDVDGGIRITNDYSGLCVGIRDRSRAGGTPVNQWPCNGQDNQIFLSGSRAPDTFTGTENEENTISYANGNGIWSDIKPLPIVPASAANLSNGKILMWSSYERYDYYGDGRKTATAIYDPVTDSTSEKLVQHTRHDMFCPGIANLPDGRILVSGGSSGEETSIYNPDTDQWETAPAMNLGRGYHSNVTLSDGGVFTVGGSWRGGTGGKSAEVFRDGQWQRLDGIEATPSLLTSDFRGAYRADNHMWLFAWENGSVFHAGPAKTMNWLDTRGDGSARGAGTRGIDDDSMNGNAVMYDIGKILTVGGSLDYDTSEASTDTHVIDINSGNAVVRTVENIKRQRVFHNSVALPSGEVVVVGGHDFARAFSDRGSVLVPELFDPVSETWSDLPAMQVPRNYHSVALLLPDGRVMSGGGGLCGDCETNHPDIEILTPPYLLDANQNLKPRPIIEFSPDSARYGESIDIIVSGNVHYFALMRSSNSTHSVNNAQRRVPLASSADSNGSHQVQIPSSSGIAPPGEYMLFAIDTAGTPSVSVRLSIGE